MFRRVNVLPWPFAVLFVLFVSANSLPEGQAQSPQKASSRKKGPTAPAEAGVQLAEADVLRKVIISVAEANHNYKGHQAKAMKALRAGLKILDAFVTKNGTAAQKEATKKGKAALTAALKAAKAMKGTNEPQPASDAKLRQAGELLAQLRDTLLAHQQLNVLAQVDTAISEIKTALSLR